MPVKITIGVIKITWPNQLTKIDLAIIKLGT